jgi:hypothetical protein
LADRADLPEEIPLGRRRWMAEVTYRTGRPPLVVNFEELHELHGIIEQGPDWYEIDHIRVDPNLAIGPPSGMQPDAI